MYLLFRIHSPGGTVCCRFGDLSVQEAVNADSFQRLYTYYEKFVEIVGEPGMMSGDDDLMPTDHYKH